MKFSRRQTKGIRIIIREFENQKPNGPSKTYTVYESTVEEVSRIISDALKEKEDKE